MPINASFAQMGPSLAGINASWALFGGNPLATGLGLNSSWAQFPVAPIAVLEPAPSSVTVSAIGASTATISWVRTSANETGFVVQVEEPAGSGNWINAAGATNPTAPGVVSFAATGLIGPLLNARVQTLSAVGPSGYTTSATFGLDNTGGGGGPIDLGLHVSASFAQFPFAPLASITNVPSGQGTGTVTGNSADLIWVDNSPDEAGFEIQIEEPFGSGNWVMALGAQPNPTAPNVTTYAATGIIGPTFAWRVRSLGAGLPSAWATSGQVALDNTGTGGGPISAAYSGFLAAIEDGSDSALFLGNLVQTFSGTFSAVEVGSDAVSIIIGYSQTYAGSMSAVEEGEDRFHALVAVASTLVSGGFLSALAAEFEASRSQVGLFIAPQQVLECAIRATRFYSGWAKLDDPTAQRGVFSITGSTYVLPGEWAIINPLFMLYVERESAIAIESSRVAGVDAVGRDSSTVEADIRQAEAELPQLAYVEPVWSVGFCPPASVNLCDT